MGEKQLRGLSLFLAIVLLVSQFYLPLGVSVKAANENNIMVTVKRPEMNMLKLTWNEIDGAEGYQIYCSETENGTYELIATAVETQVIFRNLERDKTYYYKVIAYQSSESGSKVEIGNSGIVAASSTRIGIDVSHHQDIIDWNKVKSSGIEFAIIRTSHGTRVADRQFENNVKNAKKAGIPFGVYIYSEANTPEMAELEAKYVINLLEKNGIEELEYPIAFDIEDKVHAALTMSQNGKIIKAFCDTIQTYGGNKYSTMVYSGLNFMKNYIGYSNIKDYDIWLARYNSYLGFENPVRFWQYSSQGLVSGIKGNVDMNYEYDYKESKKDCLVFDYVSGEFSYTPSKSISVKALADLLNINVNSIIKYNEGYTESTMIAGGKEVLLELSVLLPPKVTTQYIFGTGAKLTWNKVPGAEGYYIYYSNTKDSGYEKVATSKEASFIDKNIKANITGYYKVEAYRYVDGELETRISPSVQVKTTIPQVKNVKTKVTAHNGIQILWDKVTGAAGYNVYMSTSKDGKYTKIANRVGDTVTNYTKLGLSKNTTYYFKVEAYVKENQVKTGPLSTVASNKIVLASPTNVKATTKSYNTIGLTWSKVKDADYYFVYSATSKNGTYSKVGTVSTTSFTHKNLKTKQSYFYKIVAVNKFSSGELTSGNSSIVTAVPTLNTVSNLKVSQATYNSVKLTWNKVSGATGYEVYRATSKNGKYTKVSTVKTNTYTNSKLTLGKSYYYKVVAIRKIGSQTYKSAYSGILTGKPRLSTPTIKSISSGKKSLKVYWNKVSGASGYEVYRATSQNGTYKKVKTTSSTSFQEKKLSSKKKYYYKVRAYRTVNKKKIYSSFSIVKSQTTK